MDIVYICPSRGHRGGGGGKYNIYVHQEGTEGGGGKYNIYVHQEGTEGGGGG